MTWEEIAKTPWKLESKGDIDNGRDYELSAVRAGYETGFASWGWGCEFKVILFSSGVGGNSLNPRNERQIKEAKRIAQVVVDALNASEDPR